MANKLRPEPMPSATNALMDAIGRFYENDGLAGLLGMTSVNRQIHDATQAQLAAPNVRAGVAAAVENPMTMAVGPATIGAKMAAMPWFHGTRASFDKFSTPEAYLTNDIGQARQYASGVHLGGAGDGPPKVVQFAAKDGHVWNIDDVIADAMDRGIDLDTAIKYQTAQARANGVRYLEYSHPNAGDQGDHLVRVSLFPNEDLAPARPVDHDPFGAPLVPVDHDPFGGQ